MEFRTRHQAVVPSRSTAKTWHPTLKSRALTRGGQPITNATSAAVMPNRIQKPAMAVSPRLYNETFLFQRGDAVAVHRQASLNSKYQSFTSIQKVESYLFSFTLPSTKTTVNISPPPALKHRVDSLPDIPKVPLLKKGLDGT